jgi:hypothetical protein
VPGLLARAVSDHAESELAQRGHVKWQTAWLLLKDIALTGTGLVVIVLQIFAKQPSDVLLVVGLALTVPSATSHAASILSGPGVRESSPSSDAGGGRPSPPSSSSPSE